MYNLDTAEEECLDKCCGKIKNLEYRISELTHINIMLLKELKTLKDALKSIDDVENKQLFQKRAY